MKHPILRAAVLSLASLSPGVFVPVLSRAEAVAGQAPHIEVVRSNFDFGKVKNEGVVHHDFIVVNTGGTTLEISEVKPGCGCTTAANWDRRILPGQSGKIPIDFNPTGFKGAVTKWVTVTSNDPMQPSLLLQFQASIWQPVEIEPPNLYFTPIEGEIAPITKIVRITSNLEEALVLSEPRISGPAFSSSLRTLETGKKFELHVTYSPPADHEAGNGPSAFFLETSSAVLPLIKITATVMPQRAVVAMPERIGLPAGGVPAGYVHREMILNSGTVPLQVTAATINAVGVRTEINEAQPGKMFVVNVTFPLDFPLPAKGGLALTLRTSHPKYPSITVPIEVNSAPSAVTSTAETRAVQEKPRQKIP